MKLNYSLNKGLFVMKALMLMLITMSVSQKSYGSHAAGADLTYRWLQGNTYEVTAAFYRDCGGIDAPMTVSLNYRSQTCGYNFNVNLPRVNNGPVITYPCNSTLTTCNGGSTPGIQQWLYRANVTLPAACSDWKFSYEVVARNCAITTIVQPSPCNSSTSYEPIYVEALLNNVAAPGNSSPTFSNVPISFVCLGQGFNYNHGVIDINADSLSYQLITPLTSATTTITYLPGYSAASPIASSPAFSINPVTGDLFMTPTQLEVSVVAVRVNEYRNGVLIGSVIRDMQIYSRNCSPNIVPAATGIDGTNNFTAKICPGENLCFDVFSSDANPGDVVTMTWNSVIPGATFNIAGSPYPTGTFCWTPSPNDARDQPYTFTVTVRDDACPLNGLQTFSFSVYVSNVNADVVQTDLNGFGVSCNGDANGTLTAQPTGGILPFTYLWGNQATTQSISNLAPGTYTVTVTDSIGCSATVTGTITEPSVISADIINVDNPDCGLSNGAATATGIGGAGGYQYLWSNGQTTATISGLAAGTYTVTVTDANGCVASTQETLISEGGSYNTQVNITRCQGTSYTLPNGQVVNTSGVYTSTLTAVNGCDSIIVSNVQFVPPVNTVVNVSICEGDSYTLPNGQTVSSEGTYVSYLKSALDCDSIVTTNIAYYVIDIPVVTASGPLSFCPGGSVTLTSSPAASYQWLRNGVAINGATAQSYTATTSGTYKVRVSTPCGNRTSGPKVVVRYSLPVVSTTPTGTVKICSYDSLLITATVLGNDPVTYQWFRNNVAINGANSNTYYATSNGNYKVKVTNQVTGCERMSATTKVQKVSFTASLTHDIPLTTCVDSVTFTINTTASGPSFTWYRNNTVLPNVTGTTYTTLQPGTYKVRVTDVNGCTKMSNARKLIIDCSQPKRFAMAGYKIYPNPTGGVFFVEKTGGDVADITTEILDMTGRVVMSVEFPQAENGSAMEVDTDGLSAGVYYIRIMSEGSISTSRLIIE